MLEVYYLDWWCPKCKTRSNLCLVDKQGQPHTQDEIMSWTLKQLEDEVLESEVWCSHCVKQGFKTIGAIKRRNRLALVPEIWELTKLRWEARQADYDTYETLCAPTRLVITNKVQLYNTLLVESSCAVCAESRGVLNTFVRLEDGAKGTVERLLNSNATIDAFVAEVERCTVLCLRCAGAVEQGLEDASNLMPLRVSIE